MWELYSMRHKENNGEPDVFVYDNFPASFRNQFIDMLFRMLKITDEFPLSYGQNYCRSFCEFYAREKGLKKLHAWYDEYNNYNALEKYIDECNNNDFLDIMDCAMWWFYRQIDSSENKKYMKVYDPTASELNHRLKQHGLGYELLNGEIIKKTNAVTHETIVKPALKLLLDERFRGAEEEYLKSWDYFKRNENKDAIVNAAKAFESAMKCICSIMGYEFDEKATASRLVDILRANSYFPAYMANHLNALCEVLKSGAPTVRNKTSAHGQGEEIIDVSEAFAAYVLNLVASNIVFLCNLCHESS